MLAGDGFAQQAPAANAPAASTQATPAATTPKSSTTTKAPVKKTGTATKTATGAVLTTKRQKFSYALGMDIGSKVGPSLKQHGVEVDPALVSQGLKDAMSGATTKLTQQEKQTVLTEMQTEVNKKQQEKAQQAAAANKTEGDAFLAANKAKPGVVTLPSGLQYKILKEGAGPKPVASDTVSCNYRGTLINGTEFDNSEKHGGATKFGVGTVIKGWTEALELMSVGSKWQLFIPANLAYGERSPGGEIGPDSTLIFDIELVSIEKPADKPADNKTPADDKPQDKK